MRARSRNSWLAWVLILALNAPPALAQTLALDRPLGHAVWIGGGATFADAGDATTHPGMSLGLDLALGRNVSLGGIADVSWISDSYRNHERVFAGLDLKVLPKPTGRVRPWIAGSAVGSFVDDTGYGLGLGVGAYFVPELKVPRAFFADLRRYHITDMENPAYEQTTLRAGVVF